MTASNQIFLVMDAGNPNAAFNDQTQDASLPEAVAWEVSEGFCGM
jgi:hypothetical protein